MNSSTIWQQTRTVYSWGAQISGARRPWTLSFVYWRLILVGPQRGTCLMSPFWHSGA